MALVNMRELLKEAEAGGYAVGSFSVANMECIRGVIAAAEAMPRHGHHADRGGAASILAALSHRAHDARVAQNQEEYSIRYEALSARFQETKDKYDAVTAEIAQRGIRRREFGRFIHSLEGPCRRW